MHLLIVDDEPVIRQGLVKMAQIYSPAFSEVYTAVNGQEALLKIHEVQPEIVLTDIRMPKMDGLDLCRVLYESYPHIQTIVISGYNDFDYAKTCMEYGVKHYLLKPATKVQLHNVLDKLIKKPARGYIPVSRYVLWMDRMEQSLWTLQIEELIQLIEQWGQYCQTANLSLDQISELLKDCFGMLKQRFETRGIELYFLYPELPANNTKEALDQFEKLLLQLAEHLSCLRGGKFKDPIEEAKSYIHSRLSEEISLEQVASMVGLTPNYFSALFKRVTNETFVRYRIKKRMERARELLSVPSYRIADVAEEVGYEDYPHFTKTFKKIVGISPSEYRCQMGIK